MWVLCMWCMNVRKRSAFYSGDLKQVEKKQSKVIDQTAVEGIRSKSYNRKTLIDKAEKYAINQNQI